MEKEMAEKIMNQCKPYKCPKNENHNRFREIHIVVAFVDRNGNIVETEPANLHKNEPTAVFCNECDAEVSV